MTDIIFKRLSKEKTKYDNLNYKMLNNSNTYIQVNIKGLIINLSRNYPYSCPISIKFNKRDYLDYCIENSTLFNLCNSPNCLHCTTLLCPNNWSPSIGIKDIVYEVKNSFYKINNLKKYAQIFRNLKLPDEIINFICYYLK